MFYGARQASLERDSHDVPVAKPTLVLAWVAKVLVPLEQGADERRDPKSLFESQVAVEAVWRDNPSFPRESRLLQEYRIPRGVQNRDFGSSPLP
jgi:hypothetical protein